MKSATALLLVCVLLATAALAVASPNALDPLAQYRAPDGSLHIPGQALTPELQHLLFGGNDLQPYLNLSYYAPARSPYPTMTLVEIPYLQPNPNVFVHPTQQPERTRGPLAHLVDRWFAPVDWGGVFRSAMDWFFGLFMMTARASVVVDSTTVTDIPAAANTCTTLQTAAAADNGILVMLSERGTIAFLSVTYGSVSLTLVASTARNGGTFVRTEIWGFAGTLPGGAQTMTATLSGGQNARMTCATILLQGVKSTGSFINGTSNTANSTNATITLSATVASGNLGFAVAALQNTGGPGVQPTAVTGTGATATDLYGVATGHCTGGGAGNECAAGADIPNPGTAITWTNPTTTWVVSAVEVVAIPTCGTVGGGNCYRIGAGGAWNSPTNWSNSSGGASCGCTPLATDIAIFNASPTGTTTLAAATTIAAIDMTGFTGTLDTTANNWPLTVNGPCTIQGTFLPRGSTIAVSGNVTVLGAATVVTMASSSWTVNGTWTNNSTSASWSAGTGTVTIKGGASGTLTFANLGINEFNNLTLDTSAAAGVTYTMAVNGLRIGGILQIQNTAASPTGNVVLVTSNFPVTAGPVTIGANGTLSAGSSTITVGGNWTVTAVGATFLAGTSTVSFGANATVAMTQSFYNLTVTAGTATMASNITVGATLTVSGGTYAKGSTTLTTVALTLSGGALTSTSGNVTASGNVNISAAASYIAFGSESWSVAGTWTNASTSASWSAGTGTVTFTSATGGTMTFAGTNLSGNEFNNLTFTSSAATAQTFTMSTRALRVGGTLTVGDGSSTTTLDTSASNLAVSAATLTVGVGGVLTARGSSLTVTSIDTSAGTFTAGTSIIVVNASGGTVNVTQTAYNLTVNGGVSTTFTAALTWSGTLTLTSSTPTFNADLTSSGPATLTFGSATLSIAGSWNTASATAFTATSSTVTFSGSSKTVTLAAGQAFAALTISGTISQSSQLTASGPLTISTGSSLTTSNNPLTAQGTVTINGTGFLAAGTSTVAITGSVSITATTAYITSSGGSWTVTNGSWTNSSTSASWSFAAAMTFVSNASQTMTWGNLPGNEFAGAVTFDSNVVAGVTYTSAANALDVTGTLTVQNSAVGASGPTVLSTGSSPYFNISAGAVSVGTYGTLVANSSTLTVSGNWNVTAANATFAAGTSTVSFGAAATVTMTQSFYNLTVTAGTVTAGSNITVSNALDLSGGIFAKATGTLSAASLTLSGGALTSTSGNVTISGNVNVSAAASYIAFGSESWTVSGSWTNASTSASWNAGTATVTFNAPSAQTMTFAGSNLAGNEFDNVTFDSRPSTVTFTLATRALRVGSTLFIGGGTGTTTLDTSGSNLAISAAILNVTTGGALTANGSTITIASIDTHLGALAVGTSTVIVNASGGTINISQTVNNLTVNPTISTTFSGSLTWSGSLTLTSATVSFGPNNLTSSGAATMTFASAAITMSTGSWDTSSATTFTATGSSVTFSGTGNLAIGGSASFASLTITGGTRTLLTQLTTSGLLTLSGGTLAKGSNALTAGAGVTMSGGALTSASGAVSIAGDVNISSAASYISFGSETWTVSGSWSNSSTSASWAVGTASVTFDSSSPQTMTFAALPGNAAEFYNVTFNSGSSMVTFTLAGNALVWSGALSLQGGTAITTLSTSNLGLTGGTLAIGNAAVLTANASAVSVSDVTMTGGTSGTIVLTSGAWTVSGNWNTSGIGSMLSAGTSTVALTGTSTTINLATGQMFYNLTIGGRVAASSTVIASATLTVNNGAVLTKTGQSIAFNGLAEIGTGSITDGTMTVVNFTITNTDATNLTTISAFTMWTVDSEYTWMHSSTVGMSTLTFTIGGNSLGGRFYVTKDGAAFTNGLVDGSGQIVFTMLGSDPVVDVVVAAPCANTRYWVGGTGNWSDTAHWAATSGGAGGCTVPASTRSVFFDSASGGGSVTVDQNAAMASLNTTGWTGTIAIGTFDFAVGGNIVHAAGTITIGASTGNGLTVTGSLTVSGSAVLDGSGAASVVSIAGNTLISSATAYFMMGSGIWTFGGSWSNGSTSLSWTAGTGTVLFDSGSSQAMTFANLAGYEFYNVTFASTAASGAVTFTMGTNPLKWSNTLTIQDPSGSTTTLTTANLALTGGSLTVGNSGILVANGSVVSVIDVIMTGGSSGAISLTSGTWTVSGNWDTSGTGSTFTKGTSTVTLSGASKTVHILDSSNGFYGLSISGTVTENSAIDVSSTLSITGTLTTSGNSISGGANLTISGGGALIGTTASISVASVTMNDASANTISLTSGSLSVSGSWNTSGASSVFVAGTSTVTMTGSPATIILGAAQTFAALVLAGSLSQASQLTATSLTVSSGGLTKNTYPLTVNGNVTLSGGFLASTSGSVMIAGNVDVSSATSYIVFGSEGWTVSGSWTNASTSAAWSAGSGSVTFNASSSQTMTFAGANLGGGEFNAVMFSSGSSIVTFTLAARALVAHTIIIQGGSGTTTLNTSGSNLAVTADTLTVASGGALTANGSTITVRSMDTSAGSFTADTSVVVVDATGGSINIPQILSSLTVNPGVSTTFASNITWSATLNLTSVTAAFAGSLISTGPAILSFGAATLSIAGSWDTSTATALASAGSSVTFTGSGPTVTLGNGQQFATLTIAGTIALGSDLVATSLTVNASSVLTKTGYSITFNSLTVNGTIADGTANVSNMTVMNSDGTALVTISTFTTWSVGSSYAWTHTSNETAQTITWTIGGNASGFLYTVTKNGAAFASGTVDGSGQVNFTMLGSDPVMRVTVGPPPVLAWWQNPFVLMILPIGLFVVVAVFAQRARWRPAKTFLVDERGELLREFTLDASCQVTYDQVYQAGALDAVEKPVKVAKYRAQTVRGDALAVVLLAYGPVTPNQIEFAREMLVNIQDKFDDEVKQRLDDAHAYEAQLDQAREKLEASRSAFAVQSRTFAGMIDAITTAQTKMAAESASIRARVLDLKQREALLQADRNALNELAQQLEEQRASIEGRKIELNELEEDYGSRMESLQSRESRVASEDATLSKREVVLAERERELKTASEELARKEGEIQTSLQSIEERMAAVGRDRATLEDSRARFEAEQRELLQFRDSLDARVTEAQRLESNAVERLKAVEEREARIGPRETDMSKRESIVAEREQAMRAETERLAGKDLELQAFAKSVEDGRKATEEDRVALEAARAKFESDQRELLRLKASLETRGAEVESAEKEASARKKSLDAREARIVPIESDLTTRDGLLKQAEERVRNAAEKATAEHLEATNLKKSIEEREAVLVRDRAIVEETRQALGDQGREFEARIARFEEEAGVRKTDLDKQAKFLGEEQLKLAQEKDSFDAMRAEKAQWIASKEIELESREQTLRDKEIAVKSQAEENARRLADLASREESLEIEGDKIDKARAEAEVRKADLDRQAKTLEAKATQLREEEARKAEEYRTWQSTLESEQALLKEQKETFEKETNALRESWATRMLRLQMREEELVQREEKVRADVEWVARNDQDLKRREKGVEDASKSANDMKAEVEKARKDLAQQIFEFEARERALREEAAKHADELATRGRALKASEAELTEKRAQFDKETSARNLQIQQSETELSRKLQLLDSRNAELTGREARLASLETSLKQDQERLVRERSDVQALGQQLEARQVELAQVRQRNQEEAVRLRAEADAFHQATAAKEAELRSERERMERDSTALQDKLGAKAQELAAREKAAVAREAELRSEEGDLESRLREVESRERQAQAHATELDAQSSALTTRQNDLNARAAHLEETAKKLEREEAEKRKEWEDLRSTLKYQEEQLAASTESRFAEAARRMAELETREKTMAASMAQIEVERAKLADAAKAQAAKDAEAAASWSRSEKRFAELKAMETDLLKTRQTFEAERASWTSRRAEELKQLEMTRDAAAEQAQQSERLIEESQRRALLAAEAEKAAKRQAGDLEALQKQLEGRRVEAEQAEKTVEARTTQLNEAIRRFATNELTFAEKLKDLEAREARLTLSADETARVAGELKTKRTELDLESSRLAQLAADIEARRADADARAVASEAKKADLVQRERVLTTELQRAENLMEDLTHKEGEVKAREKALSTLEAEIASREATLASKDAELRDGMQSLAKVRQDLEAKMAKIDADVATTTSARNEAVALKSEAEKAKLQAEDMQKEVSKNMKFLQKKAVDVLDREETIRERELNVEDDEKSLAARAEILEEKEKQLESEREEILAKMERLRTEAEKLRSKLTDAEKAAKPAVDMEDWKKDIENRVKIIQKKAVELLDREEKLRKREEELRALAQELGVQF